MDVAVVGPSPVPFAYGGTERALAGITEAINETTPHRAELLKLPVDERTLRGLVEGYEAFADLAVAHFDLVITTKYPAWMVEHPNHTCYLFHPLRGLYDTYDLTGLPTEPDTREPTLRSLAAAARRCHTRPQARGLLAATREALDHLGDDEPALALQSPTARLVVHALDRVARTAPAVRRHLALSATVAARRGYFPPGAHPRVLHLPPSLPVLERGEARHFLTASRLDAPKRLDLLVEAYRRVATELPLLIAGGGPEEAKLRRLAANDPRVRFVGNVSDEELIELYAGALAVPFVPFDEDYGLITAEAMAAAVPVITCRDAGGPTELVDDGRTGLVCAPTPEDLAAAMARLAGDRPLARELGDRARERARSLTWEHTAEQLVGSGSAHSARLLAAPGDVPARRAGRPLAVALVQEPPFPPATGGQIRAARLAVANEVFDTHFVCLGGPEDPPEDAVVAPGVRQTVIPMTRAHCEAFWAEEPAFGVSLRDSVGAQHLARTPAYLDALRAALPHAQTALLHHPYLLVALDQVGYAGPLVLDAHNVETDLKAQLYPRSERGQELLAWVTALEREALQRAAVVIACADADAARLAELSGRPAGEIHVVPNGADVPACIEPAARRAEAAGRWMDRFDTRGGARRGPAVFVGSNHGPNVDAAELVCEVARASPGTLYVLVGAHGEALRGRRLPANVTVTGQLAARAKDALLGAAAVALNPMRQGSGTNLKVIEYLAIGVPVVSTPFGVRGLDLADGEHLLLAEPEQFAAAVDATLADAEAAHRRAVAGHAFVAERYDWVKLAAQYGRLLEGAITAPAGPPAQKRAAYSGEP